MARHAPCSILLSVFKQHHHASPPPPPTPTPQPQPQIGIVGKGLTFDSGGYNLKAGAGSMIELMKFDMGGSAATLGAARILADTQPDGVEVGGFEAGNDGAGGGLELKATLFFLADT